MEADEGRALAKAFLDMSRHYGTIVSGKTLDTMRFCMVAATVYGGRGIRIAKRKAEDKRTPAQRRAEIRPVASAAPPVSAPAPAPMPTADWASPPKSSMNGAGHGSPELKEFHFGMMAGIPLSDTHD